MESPTIKSFKLRGTRITISQIAARLRLWEEFGIDLSQDGLNFPLLFPGISKFIIEIGFGMGEATLEIAKSAPDTGFIAIDVHQPGIGKLLAGIEANNLKNIKVCEEDAHLILRDMIPDDCLDGIHLFFPDPWPKTRHNKRRIVNEAFIDLAAKKIKSGGSISIATDWAPYAHWIKARFDHSTLFIGGEVERPNWRPLTRFEGQGIDKEHQVSDFLYLRI